MDPARWGTTHEVPHDNSTGYEAGQHSAPGGACVDKDVAHHRGGIVDPVVRALPIYLTTGMIFGAVSARGLEIPLYAHQLGASRGSVGLLFTSYMVSAALVAVPSGVITDRFGRLRTLILAICVAAASQLAAAGSQDVGLLFVWQLVGGLSAGASQTALFATLTDIVPSQDLGKAMGWLTLSMQTGFFVGPAVAGLLLGWLTLQQDLLVTTIPFGVALLMSFGGVPDKRNPSASMALWGPVKSFARGSTFWALTASLLAVTLLWGTFQAYLPLMGKELFGLSGPMIGYLLGIVSVFNGATRVPAGRMVDRLQSRIALVTACTIGFAVTVAVLPHLHGFWQPTILLSLTVPLMAVSFVGIGVAFAQIAPDDSRGVAMGVYSAVLFVGLGLGPAIFAPVIQASGYQFGFLLCAVAAAILAVVALGIRHEPLQRFRRPIVPPPVVGDYAD